MSRKHGEVLTDEQQGQRIVARLNAELICPKPWKISFASREGSDASATRIAQKTGRSFEGYECSCHRFHVRRVEDSLGSDA